MKGGTAINGVVFSTAISTQKSTVRHNDEESDKNTKGTNHTADFSDVVHKASQLCYRNLQMANP